MSEDKKEVINEPVTPTEEKPLVENKLEGNLTDKQWEVAFQHPRFKVLNERATKAEKELEKFNKSRAEAEENKLKEDKKWQELAEKKDTELKSLTERITLATKTRAVIEEAVRLGIKDTDAAVKLTDINLIQLDENGQPLNAAEIVELLAKSKPYLVAGEPVKNIGADVNPDKQDGLKTVWALSDLRVKMRDHEWYTKHKEEVDSAYRDGRVDYNK